MYTPLPVTHPYFFQCFPLSVRLPVYFLRPFTRPFTKYFSVSLFLFSSAFSPSCFFCLCVGSIPVSALHHLPSKCFLSPYTTLVSLLDVPSLRGLFPSPPSILHSLDTHIYTFIPPLPSVQSAPCLAPLQSPSRCLRCTVLRVVHLQHCLTHLVVTATSY